MARKKSAETIAAEISKTKAEMSKLQDRYDRLAEQLEKLQKQKHQYEAEMIMAAYEKSGKSLQELMTFLKP